jgi:hypothetical protein
MAAIGEGDGIEAGIGIGQRQRAHFSPGFAAVFGPDLENFSLLGAAHGFQFAAGMGKETGLNCAEFLPVIDRADESPVD